MWLVTSLPNDKTPFRYLFVETKEIFEFLDWARSHQGVTQVIVAWVETYKGSAKLTQ